MYTFFRNLCIRVYTHRGEQAHASERRLTTGESEERLSVLCTFFFCNFDESLKLFPNTKVFKILFTQGSGANLNKLSGAGAQLSHKPHRAVPNSAVLCGRHEPHVAPGHLTCGRFELGCAGFQRLDMKKSI